MARMYSRKKGKHGSTRPVKRVKPSWLGYDSVTVEALVLKLAKSGKRASEIGVVLRDSYGVPDVRAVSGKNITKILKDNSLYGLPDDLKDLIKGDIKIMKHMEVHKHDTSGKRGLMLSLSKINSLVRYYKETGVLADDWVYDRAKAKTFVE